MATAKGVQVNDTVLWVEDTGEANLPVILCLHSLFLDGSMFKGLVDAAAGKYRVIRPDFRGQGKSAPATTDLVHMDTCASDIAALIDKLGLDSINVVMQSMGGDVGFRLVARRQELFRSMVILGSSARNEPPDQLESFRQWVIDSCTGGFVGDTLQMTMEVMFGKTTRADPAKQAMLNHWRDRIESLPLSLRPAMSGVIERGDARPLLPLIKIPALIFSGEEDMPRPPAWADEVAAGLPNSRLVRLAKIGHSPTLEAPEIVLPQILAFLDKPTVR
jgi:pimeloyl-ACP methyl ester carboxylesterase